MRYLKTLITRKVCLVLGVGCDARDWALVRGEEHNWLNNFSINSLSVGWGWVGGLFNSG